MIVDMNKSQLKEEILVCCSSNITLPDAVNQAVASATDKETIPEHKYIGAWGRLPRSWPSNESDWKWRADPSVFGTGLTAKPDQVTLGCLVALRDENASLHWFFVSPVSGGLKVNWQGLSIILLPFNLTLAKHWETKSLAMMSSI